MITSQDDFDHNATLTDEGEPSDHVELDRGDCVDRYLIVEPIGAGGMGVVYRAYDPKLNRGVALKILSVKQSDPQAAEKAKARLVREAQALAQLSHPNVVAVHDVGTFEDNVFLTMELVEGKTLDSWLQEEFKSVGKILSVMTAAGRGLSAAHKAGLVHRDFKPGNVIVGDDGRVRVLDFGLARTVGEGQETAPEEPESSLDGMEIASGSNPSLLNPPLTKMGGVVGTPLYMAPEQHTGQTTDERTDQFGFCVVLYEALYKTRPFAASTLGQIKSAVTQQQIRLPPDDTDVPPWLWQIIRKGLSANPENRYPTIESLLENLNRDPRQERLQKRLAYRRRLFVIALILTTTVLPIGVWYGLRYRTVQLCKAAEGEYDGVWDDKTKATIQKAFLSTGKSFAQETWERVERNLDEHQAEWMHMRSDVCEAKHVLGTQSEEIFDLRMSCLSTRKQELGALSNILTKSDAGVMQKAIQASTSLRRVSICADEKALRAPYPPPKTKQDKTRVEAARKKLLEVEALEKTGKYQVGLELVRKIEEEVHALAYWPIKAEVLYHLGMLLNKLGEYKKAETVLYQAANAAGKSKNGRLLVNTLNFLLYVVGYAQGRPKDGLLIAKDAEAVVELSGGDADLRSLLFFNIGSIHYRQAEYDKALEYYQKSLTTDEKTLASGNLDLAKFFNNIGATHDNLGDVDKALTYYLKSLSIHKKVLGSKHPDVAYALNNIGNVLSKQAEYEKALKYYRESLTIKEKALGVEHPLVASTLANMGSMFHMKEDYDKAKKHYRKALTILEKALGAHHPLVAWPLARTGEVLVEQGRLNQALEPLERAVSICEKKRCDPDPHGRGLFGLARVLNSKASGKDRAFTLAKKAWEIFDKKSKRFEKERKEVHAWLKKNQSNWTNGEQKTKPDTLSKSKSQ